MAVTDVVRRGLNGASDAAATGMILASATIGKLKAPWSAVEGAWSKVAEYPLRELGKHLPLS